VIKPRYASLVEIRVLGPLGIFDDGRQISLGGRRQRSVMAGLVINAGEAVSTERLIEFVWGDDPPPTARKSLQVYVSRLRRVLGETAVTYSPGGYLLRVDDGRIDARRFERLAEEGRRLMSTDPQASFDLI
jgi:DNA-binding SARP family transcriptional activator